MKKKDKEIHIESVEAAVARGVKVQRFEEGKVPKRAIKSSQKESEEGEKIDINLLLKKCNPEQKEELLKIARENGISVD